MIRTPDEIAPVLKRAFEIEGPVLIGVHVDYRDNHVLFESAFESSIVGRLRVHGSLSWISSSKGCV
jgi:hypothetical protein